MKKSVIPLELIKKIEQSSPMYLWIMTYGISHNVMKLAIHQGDFMNRDEVICGGCFYFSGPTKGGPYRIEISEENHNSPQQSFIIKGTPNDKNLDNLMIKCHRIQMQ
ncbi:MAG: hypothetical protein AAF639_07380 [Chloroflexota bacterium]